MTHQIIQATNIEKTFFPQASAVDILSLRPFTRHPGHGTKALDDVTFNANQGDIICILGSNGAGKTTLLKILSCLILPDKGDVLICGIPSLGRTKKNFNSIIGTSFAPERSFYPRLSGEQNLSFFGSLFGLSEDGIKNRLGLLYSELGINFEKKRFDTYSSGMQQKLSLARALLHNPGILLLDEPTRSLDHNTSLKIKQYLLGLAGQNKTTIILTMHQIKDAEDFAGTFFILDKGKALASGTLRDLRVRFGMPDATLTEIYQASIKTC